MAKNMQKQLVFVMWTLEHCVLRSLLDSVSGGQNSAEHRGEEKEKEKEEEEEEEEDKETTEPAPEG